VHGALIPIKHRSEIVTHCRPLAIVRLVAVWTRHAGPAADHLMLSVSRLVRVVFANPPSVIAAGAIEHLTNMGMARTSRQSSAKPFVHRCATIIGTRRGAMDQGVQQIDQTHIANLLDEFAGSEAPAPVARLANDRQRGSAISNRVKAASSA
jgi:hypothetical protein